ncbi:MAG: SDR family NAD(P)-dependent oxidoreductase [Mariprofundaceae bacterium]|nr:SDR family NAD(P)-dependent oxidoreductase [Mariprofundaceae bacterium]
MTNKRKIALITGASDGLGKALATVFAQDKVSLISVDRRKQYLYELTIPSPKSSGFQATALEFSLDKKT